jgi:hypothetical protein
MNPNVNFLEPMKTRYVMKQKTSSYCPPKIEYSFYQICSYPDNGFFHVRKIIYNEKFEPIDTYEKPYPKKKIEKFLEKTPDNKFQMYPTPTLKMVSLPNANQIIAANSNLLK